MNEIIYKAFEPGPDDWQYIQELANYCEGEQMLPITQAKIISNKLGLVALDGDKIVGYIAQTALYNGSTAEIGSLIVHPQYRKQGIANELIRIDTTRIIMSGVESLIAFCNPNSAPIFIGRGFKLVSLCSLPTDSLLACTGCPKKEKLIGSICCDRAYMFAD